MGEPSQDAGSQSTLEVLRESRYNDSTLITERLGYSLQPFEWMWSLVFFIIHNRSYQIWYDRKQWW